MTTTKQLAAITFALVVLCIDCYSQVSITYNPNTSVALGNYQFDFNETYHQQADTLTGNSGLIVGKNVKIEYAEGWISEKLTKVVEDLNLNYVRIDTQGNVFRKIVYNKASSTYSIGMIIGRLDRIGLFPDRFIGLEMHASGVTKKQQNELLRIFLTGHLSN